MNSGQTAKERLDKILDSHIYNPVMNFTDESLMIMPISDNQGFYFFGIGCIISVQRGEEFDLIKAVFSPSKHSKTKFRDIIVIHNIARRQLLTLKKGQYALFYGHARIVWKTRVDNSKWNGKKFKAWQLFSACNSGLYVPKAFDVKRHEEEVEMGEEREESVEMAKDIKSYYQDVIDSLLDIEKEGK